MFPFFQQNAKFMVGFLVFGLLCGLVGGLTGHETIGQVCGAVAGTFVFVWIMRYFFTLRRAGNLLNSGNFEETIKLCQSIIARYPNEVSTYINGSVAYLALSKNAEAFNFADKALALDPTSLTAFNNRSMANLLMNNLEAALDDVEHARRLSPRENKSMQSHLFATRANVYARMGEIDAALADCNESLKLDPNSLVAVLTRAHCYCVSKRYDHALADLEKANPPSAPVLVRAYSLSNRARVHLATGDLEAALADADESIRCSPEGASLIALRGLILTRAKEFDKALVDLNKAIELDPYQAEAFWFRHELHEAMGSKAQSDSDKEIAIKYQYHPYL